MTLQMEIDFNIKKTTATKPVSKYKDWELYDDLPYGWKIDKTCGSPLHGYEFCTDGKSILNGGKRALVRFSKKTTAIKPAESTEHTEPIQTDRPAPLALPGRQKYVVVRILNGSIVVEVARFETAAAAHDWCNQQPDEYESDDNFLDVYHIRNLPRLLRSAA